MAQTTVPENANSSSSTSNDVSGQNEAGPSGYMTWEEYKSSSTAKSRRTAEPLEHDGGDVENPRNSWHSVYVSSCREHHPSLSSSPVPAYASAHPPTHRASPPSLLIDHPSPGPHPHRCSPLRADCSEIKVPFPTFRTAHIAMRSLAVDREQNAQFVERTMNIVDERFLLVYVNSHRNAPHPTHRDPWQQRSETLTFSAGIGHPRSVFSD